MVGGVSPPLSLRRAERLVPEPGVLAVAEAFDGLCPPVDLLPTLLLVSILFSTEINSTIIASYMHMYTQMHSSYVTGRPVTSLIIDKRCFTMIIVQSLHA